MFPLETLDPLTALDELDLFLLANSAAHKLFTALSISLASLAALGEASLELCQTNITPSLDSVAI